MTDDDDSIHRTDQHATAVRPQPDGSSLDLPAFKLTVIGGPDAGKALVVDTSTPEPRVFVGTSSSSNLVLADPLVSRRHLALALESGHLRVQDLESTNGTRVDRLDIVEARLLGGEKIVLGDTTIEVQALGPTAPG